MSDIKITTQECVILFAYLGYVKTPKAPRVSIEKHSFNKEVKYASCDKPHRPEPVRNRSRKSKHSLNELLSRMTDKNRHEEIDFGDAVGSEVWWE